MARNRRVEISKSGTAEIAPTRVPIDPGHAPAGRPAPDRPTGAALTFDYDVDIPLGAFETPATESVFTATVKGKGKVIRGDGAVAAGLAGRRAKFETKLAEHLKGKVGVDPGVNGKPPTAKVGLTGEAWGFPFEEGFQPKLNFVYLKLTLGDLKLPELDLGDAVVTLDISVEVKVEIG